MAALHVGTGLWRSYHAGHEHSKLTAGLEAKEIALLDLVMARVEIDGAHIQPRAREQLCVDGADLEKEAMRQPLQALEWIAG